MQQDCYLLETGLLRSKQECNVCIFIHALYLLHRWWTSHSDLKNLLAFTGNSDPITCCTVNTYNLVYCLHLPPPKAYDVMKTYKGLFWPFLPSSFLTWADGEMYYWICCIKLKTSKLIETCLPQDTTTPNGLLKND